MRGGSEYFVSGGAGHGRGSNGARIKLHRGDGMRGWDCITKDLQGEDPAGQTQDSRAVARQQRGTHKRGAWLWTAQRVVVHGIPQACGYHMAPGPHLPAAQPDWLLQLRRKAVERQDRASDVERRVGDVRPEVQQVVAGKGLVLLYASLCVGRCARGRRRSRRRQAGVERGVEQARTRSGSALCRWD